MESIEKHPEESLNDLAQLLQTTNSHIDLVSDLENPVIYVMGTTASGKSKCAIELAQKVNGVIVNADSMQIYKNSIDLSEKVFTFI